MRLSVNKLDIGYDIRAFDASVTIDGIQNRFCITADEDLGEAICYVQPFLRVGNKLATELIKGKVVIFIK